MYKKLFLAVSFFVLAGMAQAQVEITARADKTSLTLDDELTLTVQVTGISGNIVMPQLPSLPAFNVYSREIEQSTINGYSSLRFRYVMLPRFVGKATIGPVTFNYQGTTYKTEPIDVQIYRQGNSKPSAAAAAAAPTPSAATASQPSQQKPDPQLPPLEAALAKQAYAKAGEPFFLVAAVSEKKPYVNQSFTLAVRFYYSQAFYDSPYQKPTVSNIFMEEEDTIDGSQHIGGTLYRYQEQRYQLSAVAPGKATIGPASVRYKVGSSPLSALDRLFGGSSISAEQTVWSAPITLFVQELPEDKPASFYGAVGSGYTLSAQASPTQVQAGEAVNVTVTVKGPGNLKTTSNLSFPPLEGFKNYPAAATSGKLPDSQGNLRGYKVFKTVLVPEASGTYTIPALAWSYFDPGTAAYKTLKTQPIELVVTPATQTQTGINFGGVNPTGNGFQTLTHDIAYLKTTYAPAPRLLSCIGQLGLVNWIFVLLVACSALFAIVGQKSLARKKAFATAKMRLKKATSCQEIADTLAVYLRKKLKIHTGSLPLKEIIAQLTRKGVAPATAESFSLLWQRLDAARFAPAELSLQSSLDLSSQALDILKLIEEETL